MPFLKFLKLSSAHAERAQKAARAGNPALATRFSALAIRLGHTALKKVPESAPRSLGITALHVCSLMYKSGDVSGATQLAERYADHAAMPIWLREQIGAFVPAQPKQPAPL